MVIIKPILALLLLQSFHSCSTTFVYKDLHGSKRVLTKPSCGNCRSTQYIKPAYKDRLCPALRECQKHNCKNTQLGIHFKCKNCAEWPGLEIWVPCDTARGYDPSYCVECSPYQAVINPFDPIKEHSQVLISPTPIPSWTEPADDLAASAINNDSRPPAQPYYEFL
ncbi:hypothetical protein PTTG_26978 [Puccinia triticina 1-1 BBBD Race 1]|uniref:TNFR-Cys domain-containing protein n=1 Tax=Puccinia triticina (isolate 1-1 / race 1 (BBBD)) TaxID=630390 RepID=A0A180GQG5_PUCT1|nr:hypothetical protein PTTG_26978 [Puccinia triticina 1-1 BBBD Race 1]